MSRRWLLLLAMGCTQEDTSADAVWFGGTVMTEQGDSTAVAVRDGRIVALGEDALALEAGQSIDLAGGVLGAGINDGHTHLLAASFVEDRISVLLVSSMESIVERVAAYAEAHPDEPWLVGSGWTPQNLDRVDGRLLDPVTGDRPTLLVASNGHEAIVNTAALRLAGIEKDTPDPVGGSLGRDPETGELTGHLIESAMALVMPPALAAFPDEVLFDDLRSALRDAASLGITSLCEILGAPGIDLVRPQLFTQLDADGELPVRVHWFAPITAADQLDAVAELGAQHDSGLVHFGGAKVWVDGSLGGLEAWTVGPYAERGDFGSHYVEQLELEAMLTEAERLGVPMKIHAMGDAALQTSVSALEAVDAAVGLQLHHSLEHVSLLDADTRSRLALLDVTASMQPISRGLAPLAGWHRELEDWDLHEAHDLAALLDAGIPMAIGTDYPANLNFDPLATLAGVYGDDGPGSISVAEALHGYTIGSGRSAGLGGELGCMDVGCIADFVRYSADPRVEDPSSLVITDTWVGGRRR